MPSDFIDIKYLGTFAGMVLAVALIVQFTKGLVKKNYSDQAVRLYTLFWAFLLVGAVELYKGTFYVQQWDQLPLVLLVMVVNVVLVTLSAMGGYEVLADPKALKSKYSFIPDTSKKDDLYK